MTAKWLGPLRAGTLQVLLFKTLADRYWSLSV